MPPYGKYILSPASERNPVARPSVLFRFSASEFMCTYYTIFLFERFEKFERFERFEGFERLFW
jgi:hypothetical protein